MPRTRLLCSLLCASWPILAAAAPQVPLLATNVPNIFSYPAPPADFDAYTASPEALAAYGFPPRPSFSESKATRRQWETLIKAARIRIQPVLQATAIAAGRALHSARPMSLNAQGVTQYSQNWSGEVLLNNASFYGSGAFTAIAGTFNVPVASQALARAPAGGII